MAQSPILYVLRDLNRATKLNAWELIFNSAISLDWSLGRRFEAASGGCLKLETALWMAVQEPWLGLEQSAWRRGLRSKGDGFIRSQREALVRTLARGDPFMAPACPLLVDEARAAGFLIQRVMPTRAQIQKFTVWEQAHHLACTFPKAADQWGDAQPLAAQSTLPTFRFSTDRGPGLDEAGGPCDQVRDAPAGPCFARAQAR